MMPSLKLYVVAVSFANGVGGISVVPTFTEAMAAGMAVHNALMTEPKPDGPITHLMAQEFRIEQLRALLRVLETGQPGEARVVPLQVVAGDADPAAPEPEPPAA